MAQRISLRTAIRQAEIIEIGIGLPASTLYTEVSKAHARRLVPAITEGWKARWAAPAAHLEAWFASDSDGETVWVWWPDDRHLVIG